MKIYTFLFYTFFLFIPTLIYGQYQPVISAEKTVYKIQFEPLDVLMDGKIRIQGDTIINQSVYIKIFLYVNEWQPEEIFVGFVREDVNEGKLWFLNKLDNQEYLVMDLQLEVGDTFATFYDSDCFISGTGGTVAKVVEISTVENRKVVKFDRGFGGGFICDTLKFIEGVGPNATVFFQSTALIDIGGLAYKVCRIYKDNTLSFPTISPNDLCGLSTQVDDINQNNINFSIKPNPNNGSFILKEDNESSNTNNSVAFKLFDITGRVVYNTHATSLSEKIIDIRHLSSGLYFYSILISGKILQSGKIIKN